MVQNSIAHQGFVDMAHFRVANPETRIGSVAIRFIFQLAVKFKNMLLDIALKHRDIRFVPFIAFEYVPCSKKVFWCNYQTINIFINLHG